MRLRDESGQIVGLSALMLGALLGMTALAVDVAVWFKEDRELQAVADAAALAGAQLLPEDPAGAYDLAMQYANDNGGGVDPTGIAVMTTDRANDTIHVSAGETVPGIFSRVLGVFDVRVGADARAVARVAASVRYVAPIAVDEQNPLLQCRPLPCFGQTTTLTLSNLGDAGASGAFGLINLDRTDGGTASTSELAGWIRDGYPGLLDLGKYLSAPGAKFNSADFEDALAERLGDELLFPVYRRLAGSGANATYTIVAWVGFVPTAFTGSGSTGTLSGWFTRVTWDGIESTDANAPDLGVRVVELIQ